MSKYSAIWKYISEKTDSPIKLTFDEIADIAGLPIDHSFLRCKKELNQFGWQVAKISIKQQTVIFEKL